MMYETRLIPASQNAAEEAARLLQNGELVAIPTETVYGLAASAYNDAAIKKIFAAKGRPQDNPLIVHICDIEELSSVASDVPRTAEILAKKFWPGPLTMIMPKAEKIAPSVSAGLDTVAVRMPSHPAARDIIKKCGIPLAAPSANLSGSPSPTTAQYVMRDMRGRIPLIIDGGSCEVGVESTVISLVGRVPVLLRPGFITPQQIEQALECKIEISHAVLEQLEKGEKAASPGMKYKHYAPAAQVTMVCADSKAYAEFVNEKSDNGVFALCFDEDIPLLKKPYIAYGSEKSPQQQAQKLFTALRRLDEQGAETVYAHAPQKNGVALAVYNRLLRAAAFRVIQL